MIKAVSSGLLMFNSSNGNLNFFLIHPGGPYFSKKDNGYWSIPKGLVEKGEDLLQTAKREFKEETGIEPEGNFIPLGKIIQRNSKMVHAWAFKTVLTNPVNITSNTFDLEWPPKSGRIMNIAEVDKGEFFTESQAKIKINQSQIEFLDRLISALKK